MSEASANQIDQAGSAAAASSEPSAVRNCQRKEKHWIEIVLKDEAGDPVANEPYLIVGRDGAEFSGKLDANGFVRIDNIEPGTCQVSFPEIESHEPIRR